MSLSRSRGISHVARVQLVDRQVERPGNDRRARPRSRPDLRSRNVRTTMRSTPPSIRVLRLSGVIAPGKLGRPRWWSARIVATIAPDVHRRQRGPPRSDRAAITRKGMTSETPWDGTGGRWTFNGSGRRARPHRLEAEPAIIPRALHLSIDELDARHVEIPREREIILYCT